MPGWYSASCRRGRRSSSRSPRSKFVILPVDAIEQHGFESLIIINGHGSNAPLVEVAGRQVILRTGMHCATMSWWQLVAEFWNREVRESTMPGGCAYTCELATSVYMHLTPDVVRTDCVKGAVPYYMTTIPCGDKWYSTCGAGPMTLVEWTGSISETGVLWQPELATAEKGNRVFEQAVSDLIDLARWRRARPAFPRCPRRGGSKLPFDL